MAALAGAWLTAAPWLAVAGAGALHGLNPCSGWALAAACRHPGEGPASHALQTLGPLALGHLTSVGLVAGLAAAGWAPALQPGLPGLAMVGLAGLPLVGLASRPAGAGRRAGAGRLGLALWSFGVATAQGSGLMLLPALLPLCLAGSPAREITASGSLGLALAAVGLHLAAMLATAAAATGMAGASLARLQAWRARRASGRPA